MNNLAQWWQLLTYKNLSGIASQKINQTTVHMLQIDRQIIDTSLTENDINTLKCKKDFLTLSFLNLIAMSDKII